MQPAAGVASHQQWVGGMGHQGGDGGVGDEEHAGSFIGAGRISESDADLKRVRGKALSDWLRQDPLAILIPFKDTLANSVMVNQNQ